MSKKEAMQILIRHAAANCAGVGQGIRTMPSEQERERVKEAIVKLYPAAYGYPVDSSVLFNLGLS